GAYKGEDEPEWGKQALPPLERAFQVIKELDPNHPLVIIQAPRGTIESMRRYNLVSDITGADIYPVGYPPGKHSQFVKTNAEISMTGDYTRPLMGGGLVGGLSEEDRKLGWNWHFWNRVLRPVIEEIGTKSPLYPALVAPDSKLPVNVKGEGIEFCVREVGDSIFLLACKREGATIQARFSGLPEHATGGEVLFES